VWHPTHDHHASGDEGLARVATAQDGVVSLAQLRALGLGRGAVDHRLGRGRLHRVHARVFAVGHPVLTRRGRLIAAVLAAGPGAVLSHRSAGAHHGVRPSSRRREDLIVPTHRRTPGLDLHRCRLHPGEVTEIDGIPCTTVVRTLVDLADVVPTDQVRKALVRAEQLRIVDFAALLVAATGCCGSPGGRSATSRATWRTIAAVLGAEPAATRRARGR
jgi:predicted transcriptional regulator of viral defense system